MLASLVTAILLTVTADAARVTYDPNPTHAIVACAKASHIHVYDLRTGLPIKRIATQHDAHELTIDHRNNLAFVSVPYRDGVYGRHERHGSEIEVIDLTTLEMVHIIDTWPHFGPHDLAVDEKKNLLYCSFESLNGSIVAYSSTTWEQVKFAPDVAPGPHWMTLLPDGSRIYTANKDANYVSVVDMEKMERIATIEIPNGAEGIISTLDGKRVFVSSQSGHEMTVINTTSNTVLATVNFTTDAPGHFALHPNGKLIYIVFNETDHGVVEMDIETMKITRRIPALSGMGRLNLLVTPNGKWLYVDNRINNTISVVDLEIFEEVRVIPTADWPHGMGLFSYYPDNGANSLNAMSCILIATMSFFAWFLLRNTCI